MPARSCHSRSSTADAGPVLALVAGVHGMSTRRSSRCSGCGRDRSGDAPRHGRHGARRERAVVSRTDDLLLADRRPESQPRVSRPGGRHALRAHRARAHARGRRARDAPPRSARRRRQRVAAAVRVLDHDGDPRWPTRAASSPSPSASIASSSTTSGRRIRPRRCTCRTPRSRAASRRLRRRPAARPDGRDRDRARRARRRRRAAASRHAQRRTVAARGPVWITKNVVLRATRPGSSTRPSRAAISSGRRPSATSRIFTGESSKVRRAVRRRGPLRRAHAADDDWRADRDDWRRIDDAGLTANHSGSTTPGERHPEWLTRSLGATARRSAIRALVARA